MRFLPQLAYLESYPPAACPEGAGLTVKAGRGRRGRRFVQDNWDSGVAAARLVGILEGIRQT